MQVNVIDTIKARIKELHPEKEINHEMLNKIGDYFNMKLAYWYENSSGEMQIKVDDLIDAIL